ncbi:MAG: hypothetical protein HY072_02330 [Deltaproteobacteria bacterium]|nr:hypothetical protein [Deltaproteobacteria bacterium]
MYKQKPTPAWQKEQITEHTTSPDTESSISESFLEDDQKQKSFFDFPGPLFSVKIYPASNLVSVNTQKNLRAVTKDKKNKPVHEKLNFSWQILEGQGSLLSTNSEIVNFHAPNEPGLIKIGLTASQELLSGEKITCISEAILTITDSLIAQKNSSEKTKGLPGYTFQKAPGALWRSKYDSDKNLIIINNGHKDFVFSSQNKTLKLRYLCRLFAKELVKINFPGCSTDELLERLIEVSLYTEERLK